MFRNLLIGIVFLLLAGVAAIFIVPSFIDWNRYKPEISARAQEAIGRDLIIEGDISLSVLPRPTLHVEKVRVANLPEAHYDHLASLESLNVEVALLPLLSGRIAIEDMTLVSPTIWIESLPNGKLNIPSPRETSSQAGQQATLPEGEAASANVQFDTVRIENGTLHYYSHASGEEQSISQLNTSLSARTLAGPYHAEGSAVLDAYPLSFRLDTDLQRNREVIPLRIRLALADNLAEVRFNGNVLLTEATQTGPSIAGELAFSSSNLASLGNRLAQQSPLPQALATPFSIEGKIEGSASKGRIYDVAARLADASAQASASWEKPGDTLQLQTDLNVTALDLDRILASAKAEENAETPPATESSASPNKATFSFPKNIDATLQLGVGTLVYNGGTISDAKLVTTLKEGVLRLSQVSATLPGSTSLSGSGALQPQPSGLTVDGQLALQTERSPALFDWLKIDTSAIQPQAVRRLSLKSQYHFEPGQVALNELDAQFGETGIKGGVTIALPGYQGRTKPAYGIGLSADQLNLDKILVADSAEDKGEDTDTARKPLAALADYNANLDLQVGSLTYNKQTARGVQLNAVLQNGTLTLKPLKIQEFAGGSGEVSGTITSLETEPQYDGRLNLNVKDGDRLLQFAGIEKAPETPKLGAVSASGTLAGDASKVTYDMKLSVQGIGAEGSAKGQASNLQADFPRIDSTFQLSTRNATPFLQILGLKSEQGKALGTVALNGKADSTADQVNYTVDMQMSGINGRGSFKGDIKGLESTPVINSSISIEADNAAPLLALAGAETEGAGKLGKFALSGEVKGARDNMNVNLTLNALQGSTAVAGEIGKERYNLNVKASYPELQQLLTAVTDLRPAGKLGAFALDVNAVGEGGNVTLNDLKAQIGQGQLSGNMTMQSAGGKRQTLAANLQGTNLDLRGLSPASGAAGSSPNGTGSQRWSTEPYDLSALRSTDAEITLAANRILYQNYDLQKVELNAHLQNGELRVNPFKAIVNGGPLNVTGVLDAANEVPSLQADVSAEGLALESLVQSKLARVKGPLNVRTNITSSGASEAQLVSNLNGSAAVNGNVTILTEAQGVLGSTALDLLGANLRLPGIQGITGAINTGLNAFAGQTNEYSADFAIERGILKTSNFLMTNPQARMTGTGAINLPQWQLDMAFIVFTAGTGDTPYMRWALAGPINSPSPRILQPPIAGGAPTGPGGLLENVIPDILGNGQQGTSPLPIPLPGGDTLPGGNLLPDLLGGGNSQPAPTQDGPLPPLPAEEPTPAPPPQAAPETLPPLPADDGTGTQPDETPPAPAPVEPSTEPEAEPVPAPLEDLFNILPGAPAPSEDSGPTLLPPLLPGDGQPSNSGQPLLPSLPLP